MYSFYFRITDWDLTFYTDSARAFILFMPRLLASFGNTQWSNRLRRKFKVVWVSKISCTTGLPTSHCTTALWSKMPKQRQKYERVLLTNFCQGWISMSLILNPLSDFKKLTAVVICGRIFCKIMFSIHLYQQRVFEVANFKSNVRF